ncbi:unnamed protein product, partial [marine sediment metagenome]
MRLRPSKLGVIVAIVLLVAAAVGVYRHFRVVEPPPADPCLPVKIPELRPSAGLAWSKRHYPEQYAASNWQKVGLEGLDDRANERFIDVRGRAYCREFISNFSYTDPDRKRPQVQLEYLKRAETFVGKLTARGLKPYFAYQIKLRGIFSDRESFERIGYLGRWRLGARLNCP